MKKLISASKRKWVLGGVLGFAAVALMTTGFATWIVGVSSTKADSGNIGVTVDTVKNNSVGLSFELDASDSAIKLEETVKTDTGVVTNSKANPAALDVTLKTLSLQVGDEYLANNEVTGISFKLLYKDTDVKYEANDANKVDSTANKIGAKRTGTSWTYIEAPVDITFTEQDIIKGGATAGLYTFDVMTSKTLSKLSFQWGSFFENKSPATFYNEKFNTSSVTQTEVNNIYTELSEMETAFTTGNIILTAELIVGPQVA